MKTMEPEERFERIERQIEFLAASQAQHDARMAEISRIQEESSRQIEANSRQIEANSAHIGANSTHIEAHSAQFEQLADVMLGIGRAVEDHAHRFIELVESQRRTDERLNVLVGVVERYFSG